MTNALPQAIEIHTGLHAYPTLKTFTEQDKGMIATVLFGRDQQPKPENIFFIHKTRFVQTKEPKPSADEGAFVYKLALMDEAEYMKTPEYIRAASFGVRKVSFEYWTNEIQDTNGNFGFEPAKKAKPFIYQDYDLFSQNNNGWFTISEGITGTKIYTAKKLKDATEGALEILSKNPFDEGIKSAMERFGISPRYCKIA